RAPQESANSGALGLGRASGPDFTRGQLRFHVVFARGLCLLRRWRNLIPGEEVPGLNVEPREHPPMKRSILFWVGCPILLGTLAFAIQRIALPAADPLKNLPRIVYSPVIDGGSHEIGMTAFVKLPMENRGEVPLRVGNIRTSCACIGFA